MPVRSLNSSLMRWPGRDKVHAAACQWAQQLAIADPRIIAVGYFGSYARGEAGVGSDLDLMVIIDAPATLGLRAGAAWKLEHLPVAADLLIYSSNEWTHLAASGSRFYRTLCDEVVWLECVTPVSGRDRAAVATCQFSSSSPHRVENR